MDKKKQMNFNINNFLLATTEILDTTEIEKNGMKKNHSKRVAYVSIKIGEKLNLDPKQMFTLCAYSLFHNYISKENCEILGIYDDMGILSRIVNFSHHIDETYFKTKEFISIAGDNLYLKEIEDIFLEISTPQYFWLDLQNENSVVQYIYSALYDFTSQSTFEDVLEITAIFGSLEEDIYPFVELCHSMTIRYQFEHKDKMTFLIAASMVNFGKLSISKSLINKKEKLTKNQLETIQAYVYNNKLALSAIYGFDDITKWATRIQEKLNGSGYPYSLESKELSLKERLMQCLYIYYSLISKKSYRDRFSHTEAIEIMREMGEKEEIDNSITNDIDKEFGN